MGSGTFGEVYEVFDRALHAERAMKVIPAKHAQELMRKLTEAKILEVCKHKHVVDIREADVRKVDGKNCVIITTELLAKSADDELQAKFLSIARTIRIIREALFGLEHLHVNHVVHADIKPANIMLGHCGTAKLSDFGLSIRMKLGEVPGGFYTLHVAPEQFKRTDATSPLSDIYSMGVTLYRLLNNIKDFQSIAPPNVRPAVSKGRFPDRKGYRLFVPTKLRRICNKAMSTDSAKRFASASKFGEALDKLRVDIDWRPISKSEWVGSDGKWKYRILADARKSGWFVDCYKNDRRILKHCESGLPDVYAARQRLEMSVAETTLA